MPTDRSKDKSRELVEVRTVRSRALNAVKSITEFAEFRRECPKATWYGPDDPDAEEMKAALLQAAALLDRWAKG